jgi:hypothetical protein
MLSDDINVNSSFDSKQNFSFTGGLLTDVNKNYALLHQPPDLRPLMRFSSQVMVLGT